MDLSNEIIKFCKEHKLKQTSCEISTDATQIFDGRLYNFDEILRLPNLLIKNGHLTGLIIDAEKVTNQFLSDVQNFNNLESIVIYSKNNQMVEGLERLRLREIHLFVTNLSNNPLSKIIGKMETITVYTNSLDTQNWFHVDLTVSQLNIVYNDSPTESTSELFIRTRVQYLNLINLSNSKLNVKIESEIEKVRIVSSKIGILQLTYFNANCLSMIYSEIETLKLISQAQSSFKQFEQINSSLNHLNKAVLDVKSLALIDSETKIKELTNYSNWFPNTEILILGGQKTIKSVGDICKFEYLQTLDLSLSRVKFSLNCGNKKINIIN